MLTRFRNIAYLMAYAVATIPLWHYIHDSRIIALMLIVVTFAHINVVLTTVQVAQPILSSEKSKTPLPCWLPNKPKYHKWWLIVRCTFKWHLLLVPVKMGLALAFTQWLFASEVILVGDSRLFTHLYMYISHNSYPDFIASFRAYPQWETIFIALCLLIVFSLLETFIISSISLAIKIKKMMLVTLTGLRLFISLGFFGLLLLVYGAANHIYSDEDFWISPCAWDFDNPYHDYTIKENVDFRNAARDDCIKRRISETVQLALITPIDQSVLLSANIMRPRTYFGFEDYAQSIPLTRDNRRFVLRQVVAGILGICLHLGVTWIVLRFVEVKPQLS